MKLIQVASLATHIGFDAGVQTAVLESMIEAATHNLIGLLYTEFDRATVTDQFYVQQNQSLEILGGFRTTLALSRGFVVGSVAIEYGPTHDEISGAPVVLDPSYVILNEDKGELVVTGIDLRDQFINATYTAGFTEDGSDAGYYTPAQIPTWLAEAAIYASAIALDTTRPDFRFEKGQGAKESITGMTKALMNRVAAKIRYFPSAVRPLG